MGRESPSNVGLVCPAHAPTAGKYVGQSPSNFIGNFVKVAFKCRTTERLEHLWVVVTEVEGADGLRGKVNNDPVLDVGVKDGDEVVFTVAQIEDVYRE